MLVGCSEGVGPFAETGKMKIYVVLGVTERTRRD